jgi:hypothetical protein
VHEQADPALTFDTRQRLLQSGTWPCAECGRTMAASSGSDPLCPTCNQLQQDCICPDTAQWALIRELRAIADHLEHGL